MEEGNHVRPRSGQCAWSSRLLRVASQVYFDKFVSVRAHETVQDAAKLTVVRQLFIHSNVPLRRN